MARQRGQHVPLPASASSKLPHDLLPIPLLVQSLLVRTRSVPLMRCREPARRHHRRHPHGGRGAPHRPQGGRAGGRAGRRHAGRRAACAHPWRRAAAQQDARLGCVGTSPLQAAARAFHSIGGASAPSWRTSAQAATWPAESALRPQTAHHDPRPLRQPTHAQATRPPACRPLPPRRTARESAPPRAWPAPRVSFLWSSPCLAPPWPSSSA